MKCKHLGMDYSFQIVLCEMGFSFLWYLFCFRINGKTNSNVCVWFSWFACCLSVCLSWKLYKRRVRTFLIPFFCVISFYSVCFCFGMKVSIIWTHCVLLFIFLLHTQTRAYSVGFIIRFVRKVVHRCVRARTLPPLHIIINCKTMHLT